MERNVRMAKSVLTFLFLTSILFAALALLPVWADEPEHANTVPREAPDLGQVSAQALVSSTTGYLIDDGAPGYSQTAAPDGWTTAGGGYDGDYRYTSVTAGIAGDYAQWKPDLAAGQYEVLVYFVPNPNRRTDAQYQIFHAGSTDFTRISQQGPAGPGIWRSLGKYTFAAGGVDYVRLNDSIAPWGAGTYVIADAVKFAPMEVWVDSSFGPASSGPYLWGVTAFNTIQDGVDAVAGGGTVHVLPGTHYQSQPIMIDKGLTLSGDSAATTVISTTGTTVAIEMLASSVHIMGLTIEGTGVDYGIRNWDTGTGWAYDITGYSVTNNVIRGFNSGMWLRRAAGEISGNTVNDNRDRGIRIQEFPAGGAGEPTMVSDNTFFDNGTGGTDYDLQLEDTYTGTVASGNTITGDMGASEACVYVYNSAGGLELSGNTISGCTDGVYILQDGGAGILQIVDLFTNTITTSTVGVHIQRTGGTASQRQVTIGGTADKANIISGNGIGVELQGYAPDVMAEYNDWGVCNLRAIEDIVNHAPDPGFGGGTVDYEPALCVPFAIEMQADPTSLPADGLSTSKITAIARDAVGNRVLPGTMIGITTSLGTVPWGYAEAENPDASVIAVAGTWTTLNAPAYQRASSGAVRRASATTASLTWNFTGEAVSLIYMKRPTAGSVDVYVDGGFVITIDTASPSVDEFRVEDVIATWPSEGAHSIQVRPTGTGNVYIDAFRSGGIVKSNGRVRTDLTASTVPGIAQVWGSVYDGHIVTASSTVTTPVVTDFVTVTMQAADLYITKSASPTSINSGQEVTYTITYGNLGPETATDTVITDTLPTNFLYVRSSSSPSFEPPTVAAGKVVWDLGNLAVGATGTITLVARPNQSVLWCTPVVRTNGAEIEAGVPDAILGNNSSGPVNVTVVVPTAVTISAHPPSIPVSNGTVTTTLRITVTDSNANLVNNIPVQVSTTDGKFVKSGAATATVTTTKGIALAQLASDATVTTATVTAQVMPACIGMPSTSIDVPFVAALPYSATTTASATLIRVCGDTSVITATVYDSFGNLVEDGTEVQFLVVPGDRGYMEPEWVQTVNGIAVSTLRSLSYTFGERFLIVKIQARRGTQRELAELRIDLRPGLPDDIALTASPAVIDVGGDQSIIRAFVSDCAGNAVENGTSVTFAANALGTISPTLTTTNGGLAYATFKSLCTIGTAKITATANGATSILDLPLTAGPADRFGGVTVLRKTLKNCGDTTQISAFVYDRCNNLVEDNTAVVFGVAFDLVRVSPNPALTRNGKVMATVTSLNKPLPSWPKSLEQIGLASGAALPSYVDMWIEPGPPAVVMLSADPESIPINGVANFYDIIVEAEINDCSGTPITDTTPVTLQTDTGLFRESGTWAIVRPSINGVVTATLTSEERAGEVTVTATVDSIMDTTYVTFLPDEPYHVDVWGNPFDITADGRSRSQVTAWVRDYYYNPVLPGITVTFVADHGHWFESGDEYYTTTTTIGGYAFARLVSSKDYIGTVNIYAITYNDRLGPGIVQFVAPRYIYLPLLKRNAP